jgi:hypothetical protein
MTFWSNPFPCSLLCSPYPLPIFIVSSFLSSVIKTYMFVSLYPFHLHSSKLSENVDSDVADICTFEQLLHLDQPLLHAVLHYLFAAKLLASL